MAGGGLNFAKLASKPDGVKSFYGGFNEGIRGQAIGHSAARITHAGFSAFKRGGLASFGTGRGCDFRYPEKREFGVGRMRPKRVEWSVE
jgi:hypothetical protein